MRQAILVATALLAALSLGCSSQIGLGRARTLDKGQNRIGFSAETDLLVPQTGEDTPIPIPWAQVAVGYHRGITDQVELGARVWGFTIPTVLTTFGLAADGKVSLLRPDPGQGKLNISTGLSLAYHQPRFGGQPYHLFGVTLPVLFGLSIKRHEFVFGPRLADYVWTGYGQNTINAFYFGGSVGFALRIKETFDLFPEVIGMYSLTSFNGEESSRDGVGLVQLGLGFNWDL